MQLIDEQNNSAVRFLHFGKHGFQSFFEFAAEFRTRNQRAEIQRKYFAVFQRIGHVPFHDTNRKPFGDCRFAYAGFADQHGIVFRFTRKNTDDGTDFFVPPDDGIKFVLPRPLHQIAAVFIQYVVGILGIFAVDAGIAAHFGKLLHESIFIYSGFFQKALHKAFALIEERHKQMLDGNIGIAHLFRGTLRAFKQIVQRAGYVFFAARYFGKPRNFRTRSFEKRGNVYPRTRQQRGNQPLLIA